MKKLYVRYYPYVSIVLSIFAILFSVNLIILMKTTEETPEDTKEDIVVEEYVEEDLPIYHRPATDYAVLPEDYVFDNSVDVSEYASKKEIKMIAKACYGETVGLKSTMEKAAVIWCILNRVDTEGYACGKSIEYVVTFPNQFAGYSKSHPVLDEYYDLTIDVLSRWIREKNGEENVGRVLPKDYLWFAGDYHKNPEDAHNYFRNKYDNYDASNIWDWSLENPYET